MSRKSIASVLIAAVCLAILFLSSARTEHWLNSDGSQDFVRSVLWIPIEAWSKRGYLECPAHAAYAEGRITPLLLSSCGPVTGCKELEPEFYLRGCGA